MNPGVTEHRTVEALYSYFKMQDTANLLKLTSPYAEIRAATSTNSTRIVGNSGDDGSETRGGRRCLHNRISAWTRCDVAWLTCSEARRIVVSMGLRTSAEFNALASEARRFPRGVPSSPRSTYRSEWVGWAYSARDRPSGGGK